MDTKDMLKLRLAAGKTQREMAAKIGVTELAYRNWEKGNTTPKPYLVSKITEVFKSIER